MRLGDLIDVRKGKKPDSIHPASAAGYRRLIQIDDLRSGASPKYCPPTSGEVQAGETDVLIAWDGANAGTSNFGLSGVLGSTLACLRPKVSNLHTPYLGHFIRANASYLRSRCKGATVPHIDGRVLASLDVPLPAVAEQRRIAEILDKADALRAQRRAALAQLDTLTQSIFLDMFGDPATNPKGWLHERLTSACHLYGGGTPSKANPANWRGSLPWFSPKDFKKESLFDSEDHINKSIPSTTNLKLLPANTVAIVVRGMILAHTFPVSILRVPATINQDLKALVPVRAIDAQFLAHCIRAQSTSVLDYVSESAHGTKRLDADTLARIKVLDVPMELQRRFADLVIRSEHTTSTQRNALAATDALFASLQHRAFRGEL